MISGIARSTLILAVVAVLAGCSLLGQSAFDLEVGDCFDPPASTDDTVDTVQDRPCTESHGAEVVYVGDFAPSGGDYPVDSAFNDFYDENCIPAFNAYTGLDYAEAEEYELSAFRPTDESWADGDFEITCFAVRTDDAPMTQSIKAP